MLLRRAALAAGLALALVGAGAGTAAAGTGGSQAGGLLDTVDETVSSLMGEGSGSSEGRSRTEANSDKGNSNRNDKDNKKDPGNAGTAANSQGGGGGGSPASAVQDAVSGLREQAPELPVPGEGHDCPIDVEGLRADVSPQGQAGDCASELLKDPHFRACIEEHGGVVSQIGRATDLPEQLRLTCLGATEEVPPPGGGDHEKPPKGDGEPAPMPPPRQRAAPAEPAEPIVAEPSFTG